MCRRSTSLDDGNHEDETIALSINVHNTYVRSYVHTYFCVISLVIENQRSRQNPPIKTESRSHVVVMLSCRIVSRNSYQKIRENISFLQLILFQAHNDDWNTSICRTSQRCLSLGKDFRCRDNEEKEQAKSFPSVTTMVGCSSSKRGSKPIVLQGIFLLNGTMWLLKAISFFFSR